MTDTLVRFLSAATHERLTMFNEMRELERPLRAFLGNAGYCEYAAVARARGRHLNANRAPNVVVVPGVMGSMLRSETLPGVWWVDVRTLKHINDLRLSADGAADFTKAHRVVPFGLDTSYEPFLTALLDHPTLSHTVFPYDWRKPLTCSASRMRDFIVNTHQQNGGDRVHLVAHSMGGLMVRTALMMHGAELWPRIGRIVFVGTPHYGSPAIAGYLKITYGDSNSSRSWAHS